MMDNNVYYAGPPVGTPIDYPPVQGNKSRHKKIIFIIIIAVVFVLITVIIVVSLTIANNNTSINSGKSEDAEQIEYDSGDEDTGGEIVAAPDNESLDFLKKYKVSADDIASVEAKVREALDMHYNSGYNDIYYDIASANLSDNKDELTFAFMTDIADVTFYVTLSLTEDSSVGAISITP